MSNSQRTSQPAAQAGTSQGKWTRRGFITAGALIGGGLVVGVALRRDDRRDQVSDLVTSDSDTLLTMWVKMDQSGTITAIVPHSEMGQGAQTALTQMLADEMDAAWGDVAFLEAPAHQEYANGALGKGYVLGGFDVPGVLVAYVDGALHQVARLMIQQITGGSLSVRTTGVYGMRAAGAAVREMLVSAAADLWQVPVRTLTTAQSRVTFMKG